VAAAISRGTSASAGDVLCVDVGVGAPMPRALRAHNGSRSIARAAPNGCVTPPPVDHPDGGLWRLVELVHLFAGGYPSSLVPEWTRIWSMSASSVAVGG